MDSISHSSLNRIAYAGLIIASIAALLAITNPRTCKPSISFPHASCQTNLRRVTTIENKNKKLWSTKEWRKRVDSFKELFHNLTANGFLSNDSKVLCVSAGAGHEVMALKEMGLKNVDGVEIVGSPPLVKRADPHDLPFSGGVFDVCYSAHLAESLFPSRFVSEIERTVRLMGFCILTVEACSDEKLARVTGFFRNSNLVFVGNVTLGEDELTQMVMRRESYS
ncbi:hypothetical protein AMTR_s00043p00204240 [Amborella trichopoda]|uniref:Methyltransferase type 11 domain-containing protein n=2 Tax=Amborella trichopoda TaxID=13333 RepID=W1PZ13_AMBTC|nr:hypothetical protein AMTR_s00043p00204240 [Amborella trichopoda]